MMQTDLAVQRVAGEGVPDRRAAFLHGILGAGANLRTIARRFVAACPGWDAWTVDLRGHGASPKSRPDPSLAAAARDLVETAGRSETPIGMLVGHSFGGKVALEALRQGLGPPGHVFLIDSPPGRRAPEREGDSPLLVIDALRALPATFPSRDAFIDALMARGQSRTLAQWLAMSTDATDGGVRFRLDLDEIEALLLDHLDADLWPVVEDPELGARVHFVIGQRSAAWSVAERERALALAARDECVTVDLLDTGHWVHAEDPDGLVRVLQTRVGGEAP